MSRTRAVSYTHLDVYKRQSNYIFFVRVVKVSELHWQAILFLFAMPLSGRGRFSLCLPYQQLALHLLHPGFVERIKKQTHSGKQEGDSGDESKQKQNAVQSMRRLRDTGPVSYTHLDVYKRQPRAIHPAPL